MPKKVWVHGPISLDTVVYISKFPTPGSFLNSLRTEDRTGGSSANVALGLCTANVDTGFITYLGNDQIGKELLNVLEQSLIQDLVITHIEDKTNHALVLVDENLERTIITMSTPHLRELRIKNASLKSGDVVAFILWREEFLQDLVKAQEMGCFTIVGAEALGDSNVNYADLLIGSRKDIPSNLKIQDNLQRFRTIVLTDGANGATAYRDGVEIHQQSFRVNVKDTTGAGDAFIAGFLASTSYQLNLKYSLEIAAKWAASAVQSESSVPPSFDVVKAQWGIDLIP